MHLFSADFGWIVVFLAGAAVAFYVAARAAVDALVGKSTGGPVRLAIGFWIPIAVVGLGMGAMGKTSIVIAIVFASSVACLSLGIGAVTILAPPVLSGGVKKMMAMVLPVGLLAFLAGFRGQLTDMHAMIFAAQGLAIVLMGLEPNETGPATQRQPLRLAPIRSIQFVLAIALAGIGAWAAGHGADRASRANEFASPVLVAAILISPLLILPMLGTGVDLAHRGQPGQAVGALAGVVLLNLCLLLPAIIVEAQYHAPARGVASATTMPATEPAAAELSAVPFPLPVWRVDGVGIVILGLALLPVALGRWTLSKMFGFGLVAGYVAYLLLTMLLGTRLL